MVSAHVGWPVFFKNRGEHTARPCDLVLMICKPISPRELIALGAFMKSLTADDVVRSSAPSQKTHRDLRSGVNGRSRGLGDAPLGFSPNHPNEIKMNRHTKSKALTGSGLSYNIDMNTLHSTFGKENRGP